MNDQPLRLATGSHMAGSGRGCAMNVVSWENGDTKITDFPPCSDQMLTRIVQGVNDTICTHGDEYAGTGGLLCPDCSMKVLDLAHRTVGTGGILTGTALRVVWVRVACALARDVAHLNTDPRVMAAIEAAEQWADDPTAAAAHAAAANAATTAAHAAAANAANAAYAATYAANAATTAAYAATYAAAATSASRLDMAHRAIDLFQQFTGHTDQPVETPVVQHAVQRMLATT